MKLILFMIGAIILVASCSTRNENTTKDNLSKQAKEDNLILPDSNSRKVRYPDPRDSVLRNYIDHRKPPRDSIDKWNEKVFKEKEKFTINPDKNTIYFTINPTTGEVNGCPLIKFKGALDDEYWKEQKYKRDSLKLIFEQIKPVLRRSIMEDKKEDLWYGDPKNVEIEGTLEGVHSGRGPIGYLFTKDSKYIIVPVGYPHGGIMDEIYFFDSQGKFITKTILDRPLNMPFVEFNAEQTFVIVSNGVSGDFYFFRPDGQLFKKGDYNKLTGDRGTSYGNPNISLSGEYWFLKNNLFYVFKGNEQILKISGIDFYINEDTGYLFNLINRNKLALIGLKRLDIEYLLSQENIRILQLTQNKLMIQIMINKKIFSYEIL